MWRKHYDGMRALQQSLTSVELERPTHPLRELVLRLLVHERTALLARARQLKATQAAWRGGSKALSVVDEVIDPTNFLFTLERHVQGDDASESEHARSLTATMHRCVYRRAARAPSSLPARSAAALPAHFCC